MRLTRIRYIATLLLALGQQVVAETVHHRIEVRLEPSENRLEVTDRVTLPEASDGAAVDFLLHAGLEPRLDGEGGRLSRLPAPDTDGSAAPLERYSIDLEPGATGFTLAYGGTIHHPVRTQGREYARSFGSSPGIIAPQGVFLGGASHWCPSFEVPWLATFELTVDLPEDWRSVSQGRRSERMVGGGRVRETWAEEKPQDEIFLIAGAYTEYRRGDERVDAMVFLRGPDPSLAGRYLGLTGRYIHLYEGLIGPYPYAKFALVENFWETGYGMPSFTLLGPRVIRLPFIPHTSYPHEILHNWWGNGVYVDYATGNWAEGLTSYLADHLLKEQAGKGAEYRRNSLQAYADYVDEHQDLALTEFRGRHDSVTQSVGYGKSAMVFHMLRRELGDDAFIAGLRRLYADNAFRIAGWSDVAAAFEAVSDRPLDAFFEQWVERRGAPEVRLGEVDVVPDESGFRIRIALEQVQDGPHYDLRVPVAVQLEGRDKALLREVALKGASARLELPVPARPLRLAIDPAFDLFRRLHREEIPPAISQALGSGRVLMLLPSAAPEPVRAAYEQLVESWAQGRGDRVERRMDDALETLPQDRAVWLLGWENRFRPELEKALAGDGLDARRDKIVLDGKELTRQEHGVVVLARNPDEPDHAIGWIAADDPAVIPTLGRKLPHYGKYSYLAFAGAEARNVLKGQWPVTGSTLTTVLADPAGAGLVLEEREPLAELPPAFSAARMLEDIRRLADPALQGRGLGSAGLDSAADDIAEAFRKAGLEPGGDPGNGHFQTWRARAGEPERLLRLRNVVGVLPGGDPQHAGEVVVVGAHYDHLGLGWPDVRDGNAGKVHPGADDNASGVAVLLELARVLKDGPAPDRSIVFVAFTGEEANRLGSRHYLQAVGDEGAGAMVGMLNLDTVGRLGDGPLYAIGAGSAREWAHILRGAGYLSGVTVTVVEEPLDSSDQVSFIEAGIPAVQLFSGAHADYHRPSDTLDSIDPSGLVGVASVARHTIDHLAGRDGRLTAAVAGSAAVTAEHRTARRAALGTVPDFAYRGEGVRLAGVNPGSPAESAGLREGDVLTAVNGTIVQTLGGYADFLRRLDPGDPVEIRYVRNGEARTVDTRAVKR
jgi:acetylornithine deacetylase/succinyl-diaminopimelate desuccinylase-like protein